MTAGTGMRMRGRGRMTVLLPRISGVAGRPYSAFQIES